MVIVRTKPLKSRGNNQQDDLHVDKERMDVRIDRNGLGLAKRDEINSVSMASRARISFV